MQLEQILAVVSRETDRAALLNLAHLYHAAATEGDAGAREGERESLLDRIMAEIDREMVAVRFPKPTRPEMEAMIEEYCAAGDGPTPDSGGSSARP